MIIPASSRILGIYVSQGFKIVILTDDLNVRAIRNKGCEKSVFGRIYEYCLAKFAIAEGKGTGEFYTPKSVVELLCELIEPYEGIIYDGACGSGGMFVQSMKFIERHQANTDNISVYGQEYTPTTRKLAMMNLAIRGISADIGTKAASTFQEDQHPAQQLFGFLNHEVRYKHLQNQLLDRLTKQQF